MFLKYYDKEVTMELKPLFKSFTNTLGQMFAPLEREEFDEAKFDQTITQIVNLRTPGLSEDSQEFDESYTRICNEVSANCQGKRRHLLLSAQDTLQQEKRKQSLPFIK